MYLQSYEYTTDKLGDNENRTNNMVTPRLNELK